MILSAEFQAVIMAAGKGSRVPELTAGKPKCLLPVGPKPLVWYPLCKLQSSGFTETILVVLESQRSEIQGVLDKLDLEIKVDIMSIPEDNDLGTADTLRIIYDRLKSDVLVMSCDLITDCSLKGVLDTFRMHNASMAALFFRSQQANLIVPGSMSKYKLEKDLIGQDKQTNRLVFYASASDFEGDLSLPRSLLKKHTHIDMHSDLVDGHVYVIRNWVLKYLNSEQNITSIKGELLPLIVKKQLAKPPVNENKSVTTRFDVDDIFNYSKENDFDTLIREFSNFNDHAGDLRDTYHGDSIRCYAFVAPAENWGIRVNTLSSYWNINSTIIEKFEKLNVGTLCKIHDKTQIKSNQIDDKCIVWKGTKLHEKTAFKNSIIGANCEVNSFSRVFNSIVMNNVTIKKGVALENCIVCDDAIIESGCVLKNCIIGSNHTVCENSHHTNEVLTESDRMLEF